VRAGASEARNEPHPWRGYLCIAAAALCWAISAGSGKAVFSGRGLFGLPPIARLDPLILSQMRTTLSFLLIAPVLLLIRGRDGLRTGARNFGQCVLLGILGMAASNFFYYFASAKTTVSLAIIVQYTAPVWVLLYMVAMKHQYAGGLRIIAVFAAVTGCALALGIFGQHAVRLNWIGVAAALGAAFSFSFYNVYGRRLLLEHERWKVIAYALLGAALFWIVINPPQKIWAAHYCRAQWIFMAAFALASMLIPTAFYFAGLHYLDPTRAVVTSCLEPVFTILVAALFLGESFTLLQTFGMALVLTATVLIQLPSTSG
jgi:drug/metabolite transporter (DMT)-like permease